MAMILQNNKELIAVAGDLLFKYGDFPGADKIMERLQKEIKQLKPYLFDDKAPTPQMQQMQQAMQRLTAINTELIQKLAMKEIALKGKDERRDIDASHAQTDRMKVTLDFLTKVMLQPDQQQALEHELIKNSHDASLQMIVDTNAATLQPSGEAS